jgi:hypothetical protein
MKKYHRILIILVGATTFVVGCTGQSLDLGSNADPQADGGVSGSRVAVQDGGASDATVGTTGIAATADASASVPTAANGAWTGYIENWTFPSGSDALMLGLASEPDGGLTGYAIFGGLPFYSAPTDPSVGYPNTLPDAGYVSNSLEGFRYTLLDPTMAAGHLRATVDPNELYAQWCAIQPPTPQGTLEGGVPVAYSCFPPPTSTPCAPQFTDGCYTLPDGGVVPNNHLKLVLCLELGACNCTAAGCAGAPSTSLVVLDVQTDGANATGTVQLPAGSPHNVYLTAQ